MPRPGCSSELQADRVFAIADRKWVDLQRRRRRAGDRRTDLEHVGAEDPFVPRNERVGVVLHERGSAGLAVTDHLERAQHHRGLPVALGAEPVAIGHESLDGEAGELAETAEVLEVGGERAEPAGLEERTQSELDARSVAQRFVSVPASAQFGSDVVGRLVLADEIVDVAVAGGVDAEDEVVDAERVDGYAELDLRLDLVPFGDRDVAHVVAEAGELEGADLLPAAGGPRPRRDAGNNRWVGHMAGDGLTRRADAGEDVSMLPVAVGGLVEIHEVHVDRRPRQLDVCLRVQVEQRLLQRVDPVDPHLRRGERVHPRDHADAGAIRIGLEDPSVDRRRFGEHRLELDREGDRRGGVELLDDDR